MPPLSEAVNEPRKPRILIADDSSGMRAYLRAILANVGYGCMEAEDGAKAFDAIMAGPVDLLIADLDMPVMDGFQLLSAISLMPKGRRPRIIVCSALLDERLAERRPELRMASVLLAKPVQPKDVLKAVEKAMNARIGCC